MLSPAATDLLEQTRAAFHSFRAAHQNKRPPLPDQLWQMAISLLDHFSIARVCRELRLSPQRLRHHRLAANSTSVPTRTPGAHFCQVQPEAQPLAVTCPPAAEASAPHSVTALPVRCVLERTDGTRLSLFLPAAADSAQLLALYSLFLRG